MIANMVAGGGGGGHTHTHSPTLFSPKDTMVTLEHTSCDVSMVSHTQATQKCDYMC